MIKPSRSFASTLCAALLLLSSAALAQAAGSAPASAVTASAATATTSTPSQLQLRFSCSQTVGEGEQRQIFADFGEIALQGEQILSFRWESSLHRRTHGFDCSIDQEDDLLAERIEQGWRVSLRDAAAARLKRGYDTARGKFCSVRVLQEGEEIHLLPTCAVLCGSRDNFSELRINLRNAHCQYE